MKFIFSRSFHLLLVALQLLCIAYMLFTGPLFPHSFFLLVPYSCAILFALWAMVEMKFNFTILPSLPEGRKLITTGPYALVRHPMYTSLLAIILTLVMNEFSEKRLAVWAVLFAVLMAKSEVEERILGERFPEFSDYKKSTKRLIPFLI